MIRIITVYDANNYKSNVSHQNDELFFSDFFLFHHLFANVSMFNTYLSSWNTTDIRNHFKESNK